MVLKAQTAMEAGKEAESEWDLCKISVFSFELKTCGQRASGDILVSS